jgi:hypothetical protein
VKGFDEASIKADLQEYLRKKDGLISPDFSRVVADVSSFTAAISRDGLQMAFVQSTAHGNVDPGRTFIEVAETIVEHHLRFVKEPERAIVRKSLLEAYTHVAGPQYILEPFSNTLFASSICRSGSRKFVTMLFSLHAYNLICMGFLDDLRARVPDENSFQLYASRLEGICCDAVTAVVQSQRGKLDEKWATAVAKGIEAQFLRPSGNPTRSYISILTRSEK